MTVASDIVAPSSASGIDPLDRLRARLARIRAPLCAGIDPHPDVFPEGITRDAAGLERYARGLVEAVAPHVAAIKLNVAFFEAFGSGGWAVLERTRAAIPREVFTILDAKRGDIASTAERYAEVLIARLDADGVTVSPYLGRDAIEPFVHDGGPVVYVLTRTSNPSAGTFQDRYVGGRPLYELVAEWVATEWPDGRVGLVVGATVPDELRRVRAVAPGLGFLVPGIGQQGGDLAAALESCHGALAPGVVTISRGITAGSRDRDWASAAAASAQAWRARMVDADATLRA